MRQPLIPIVFKYLYDLTVRFCTDNEALLFHDVEFKKNFISTGDGGFQICPTPLHALAFCAWFQVILEGFNSGYYLPNLRHLIGPLTLRYAATYDTLMSFNGNFFGRAIIRNARISSRDSLNRFLLDRATVDWFVERFGSVEALSVARYDDLLAIPEFSERSGDLKTVLFRLGRPGSHFGDLSAFRMVVVQKIGDVMAKESSLDVYNCYLQLAIKRGAKDDELNWKPLLITVGNLNTAGIGA